MILSATMTVDGDVTGSYLQKSLGLALSGELAATGPETAEGFLKGVFVIVGTARQQSATH